MRIIARYLTKEVLITTTVMTILLLLIVLSNRFAVYLAKAATGELPIKLVFQIVMLSTPELLSYLLPLGLFFSILFAYGRLYSESEMIVLLACGIGVGTIIRITLKIALGLMVLTGILTLWGVPKMAYQREKLLAEGAAFGVIQSLLPGRFQSFSGGRFVFYMEDVSTQQDDIKGVFIAERPSDTLNKKEPWAFITAEEAELKRQKEDQNFHLLLKKGTRYQGLPGDAAYNVISFEEYGRTIPVVSKLPDTDSLRLIKSDQLWFSSDPAEKAELQWRLSLPLTLPILALIAVPFSRVRPRQGKYAKFLPAIATYIIYYNLFTVSKRWIAAGALPAFIGTWWVHLIFLFIGIRLATKEANFSRQ